MTPLNIPLFSQGDPRWRDRKLGTSGFSMWSHGCYVTATAMALNNFGYYVNPGQLCDALNGIGGFDPDGQLRWDAVEKLFPNVVFADMYWTTRFDKAHNLVKVQQEEALKRIAKCVRIGIPVILCVDVPNVGVTNWPDHATTLKYAPDSREGWLLNDPDGGKEIELKDGSKYGKPEDAIFGARVLVGHGQSYPDYSTERDAQDGLRAFRASQVARGKNVQTYAKELLESYID